MRTLISATLIAATALSLSACSGDSKDDTSASAKAVQSAAAAKTTEADGSYGARKELTKDSCTAKDGAWSFTGHLTNNQKTKQTFVVTASVVDGKTFTVYGRKEFKETLEAGKSKDLKADAFYKQKKDGTQCVIRVTRKAA